jgi:hypothetical protein
MSANPGYLSRNRRQACSSILSVLNFLPGDVDLTKGPFMSESTAILTLEQWQIRFHETMAALLRAKEAIKLRFGLLGILNGLWRSSRDLKPSSIAIRKYFAATG